MWYEETSKFWSVHATVLGLEFHALELQAAPDRLFEARVQLFRLVASISLALDLIHTEYQSRLIVHACVWARTSPCGARQAPLLKRAWVPVLIVTLWDVGQEIRFVQMELLELSQQTELESLCSAVECMIQQDPHHAQQLP